MKIFSGKKSFYFAERICKELNVSLNCSERKDFSDGEFVHSLCETVRGQNVYLVQSTFQPVDNLFELLQMADASKRAGAKSIIAVIPYLGFSRQDQKSEPRVPITSALIAKMIEGSGINHLVTMDLHNNSIEGMYNIPVSHIYSSAVIVPKIKEQLFDKNIMICSPDAGGMKKAKIYSQHLKTDMVICYKHREKANIIKEMKLIGTVKDRNIVLIDDMADTCGTLSECSNILIDNGALSVRAAVAHPVLSGRAYANIGNSKLEELIVTNSIPLRQESEFSQHDLDAYAGYRKISVIDVAPLFASIIKNIEEGSSISANFLI